MIKHEKGAQCEDSDIVFSVSESQLQDVRHKSEGESSHLTADYITGGHDEV